MNIKLRQFLATDIPKIHKSISNLSSPITQSSKSTLTTLPAIARGIAAALLVMAFPTSHAHADSQIFRQGENNYSAANDTYISSRNQNSNFGYDSQVKIQGQRFFGLLYWDLKSIPSNAQVDNVNLNIQIKDASKMQYYVYAMPKPWREMTANWANLKLDLLDKPVLGILQATRTGNYSVVLNEEGQAVVQGWIQGAQNNGFVIASESADKDGLIFLSKESRKVNLRPALEVSYSVDGTVTPVPTSLPTALPTTKPTTTPSIVPTATSTPIPKQATYSAKCSGCHGELASSAVAGSTASSIKDAIDNNIGGMGYLNTLTNADLNSIATELGGDANLPAGNPTATPVPTTPPTPTNKPTAIPTVKPTIVPTTVPTVTNRPTVTSTAKPTSTPTLKPTATPVPALATYASKCSGCHGSLNSSNVSGADASVTKDAIDANRGGMGKLSTLTNADLNSIALELGGKADLVVATPTVTPTPVGGGGNPTATPKPTPITSVTPTSTPTPAPSTAKTVIDVMVLYTTQHQTSAAANQRLSFLTTLANQAYKDSFMDLEIRLVHTEPVAYPDGGDDIDAALNDLEKGVGVFSNVENLRAQYGADLVVLFRPYQGNQYCGVAEMGWKQGGIKATKADAYSVVDDGSAPDGSGYYCDDGTFHHELGHNMGLEHERKDANPNPAFSYAYAWGQDGVFGTVMGYAFPKLNFFSTPLLPTQCKGTPCGYPKTDASRSSDQTEVVNYTAPFVADFYPSTTVTPVLQ